MSADPYAALSDDIWKGLDPDDRANLLDPAVEQMANASDALQHAAVSLDRIGARFEKACTESTDRVAESLKRTADVSIELTQVYRAAGEDAADSKQAIIRLAAEQAKVVKALAGLFEVLLSLDKKMTGVETALRAPKTLIRDADGKPTGVRIDG